MPLDGPRTDEEGDPISVGCSLCGQSRDLFLLLGQLAVAASSTGAKLLAGCEELDAGPLSEGVAPRTLNCS